MWTPQRSHGRSERADGRHARTPRAAHSATRRAGRTAARQLKPDKPKLSKPMCRFVVLACEDLLKYAATDPAIDEASALVFAPGVGEIEELYDEFLRLLGPERYDLIMLHSRAPPEEQDRALQPASYGKMKVVISTNIAESSITIPDVYVIVDLCMVKEVEYDAKVGANSLKIRYASQASCRSCSPTSSGWRRTLSNSASATTLALSLIHI